MAGAPVEKGRLFVALDLPEAVRVALARWATQLSVADPGVRPVRAEAMHATLCFLGDRPLREVDAIGSVCAQAVGPPVFELATGGLLGLPSERRPRVLATALEDRSHGLAKLQERLAGALSDVGAYRLEARPFLPHVTLARVRTHGRREAGRGEAGRGEAGRIGPRLLAPIPFTASSVSLYRSRAASGGQVYEPLRSVFLDVPS